MVGRSSVDAKRVVAVDGVSREHVGLSVDGGELSTKDLGRCTGATLNGRHWCMPIRG